MALILPSAEPTGPTDPVSAPEDPPVIVEQPGFTVVEDDDVAFSLRLCREVHRLYGEYAEGRLPADESVAAGLTVTIEMLATLSRVVKDGMPGMRLTVAGAQAREMFTVMFGRDPLATPLEASARRKSLTLVADRARQLEAPEQAHAAPGVDAPLRRRRRWPFGRRRS